MTKIENIHNYCKNEILNLLNDLGFNCIDFEKERLGLPGKIPDLKEKFNNILIEVKILTLNSKLETENEKIIDNFNRDGVATYWFVNTPNFRADLDSARRKFRDYPGYKSMVIFINLMKHQEQSLEELIEGEEYFNINAINGTPSIINSGFKGREIRENKNKEIGAIAQYFPKDKKIKIIHNNFADEVRKIPLNIFKEIKIIEQLIYDFIDNENKFINIRN